MSHEITLSWHEIYMGACVGVTRRIASLKRSQTNKVNNVDFGWHSDIEGACAEIAVGKLLDRHWDGSVNTFKAPDVGNLHVRHTQRPDGSLIIRGADGDSDRFCLVVGTHPTYSVLGWIAGGDAKTESYERNPGGSHSAWFVPQSALHPMAELVSDAR